MTANNATDIAWPLDCTALPMRANLPWRSMTARMTRIDTAPFNPTWFRQAGIVYPDNIARSVARRQAEYFFGRWCAQQALQAAGLAPTPIATGAGRAPVWPSGIVGSITHDARFAAAIIAPAAMYAGIGIDIETVPSAEALEALASTVLSATEMELLRSLSEQAPLALLMTAVFSAKESFFKASYGDVGHYFDFDAVSVRAIDMARGLIELEQELDLCQQLRAGQRHRVLLERLEPDTVYTLFARPLPRSEALSRTSPGA